VVMQRALVTGAASGIGRAIAAKLEAGGARVLAVDLRPDPDGPGDPFEADLTTREGNRDAVAAAAERLGGLDLVVANAGIQQVAPVAEFPDDEWDRILALLLTSPFLLAKHAWPHLAEAESGRFIAVASAHGLVASPHKAAYVAAKHGVLGLVKTLALEGAEQGILATAVCPGYVRTPLVEAQLADKPESELLAPHAIKRLIEPEEVAEAVAFLAGPGGTAFTGAAVPMDLGWTAR
jgi:3-hydroxybutyrate dehydrogenase